MEIEKKTCVHNWYCSRPKNGIVHQVCRLCGDEKDVPAYPDTTINSKDLRAQNARRQQEKLVQTVKKVNQKVDPEERARKKKEKEAFWEQNKEAMLRDVHVMRLPFYMFRRKWNIGAVTWHNLQIKWQKELNTKMILEEETQPGGPPEDKTEDILPDNTQDTTGDTQEPQTIGEIKEEPLIMNRKNTRKRKAYYDENKDAIQADFKVMTRKAVREKWGIPDSSITTLLRRWAREDKVKNIQAPPAQEPELNLPDDIPNDPTGRRAFYENHKDEIIADSKTLSNIEIRKKWHIGEKGWLSLRRDWGIAVERPTRVHPYSDIVKDVTNALTDFDSIEEIRAWWKGYKAGKGLIEEEEAPPWSPDNK